MIDEAARAYIMEVARAYFALKNLARLPWSVSKRPRQMFHYAWPWLRECAAITQPAVWVVFPYVRACIFELCIGTLKLCLVAYILWYGPLLHLRILNVPIVLVSSASVAHEIFKDHDMSVFSHGAIGIDECLVFGAFGFIKAPYGDYWKFMKKLITTNMLGPQALERSRDVTPLRKQYSGLRTMAEIINNGKILKRLRKEIDSVRLYFQGNLNKGVKIGRFYIPKATSLVINVYAVMRDPDSWKDPDEFKPERFLGEEKERREKILNFLPFGAGRRGCPGSNLAYILVGAAIGVMVQCFDWVIEGEKVNMEEASGKAFCSNALASGAGFTSLDGGTGVPVSSAGRSPARPLRCKENKTFDLMLREIA
ncbi:hypothetical protein F2Q69_00055756 [Brassica cretica]|uniref:Cytochrome P450 n=1 Tax=Brassica cretica TaxID=69181 RepID=A0A8S9MW03_BRACR|nr:hypothetical protein F2Q69_00055756 [Brassica cretica]